MARRRRETSKCVRVSRVDKKLPPTPSRQYFKTQSEKELMTYASKALNSINWNGTIHNIKVIYATLFFNTYVEDKKDLAHLSNNSQVGKKAACLEMIKLLYGTAPRYPTAMAINTFRWDS